MLGIDCTEETYVITAKQIKAITRIEPRNMAYIDNQEDLPSAFAKCGSFLLPVANGKYVIVKGNGFHALEDPGPPETFEAHLPFPMVTLSGRTGEMQQLDYAYHAGLLSRFSGVAGLRGPTIRGRQFTPAFSFRVDGTKDIPTKGVQIEVDGGYESQDSILLFEAKIGQPVSFIIRQLYYPYRTWRESGEGKKVRTFFMTSKPAERIFSLWEYEFTDVNDYESIQRKRSKSFMVMERPFEPESFAEVSPAKEHARVIPQADDITKVLEFPFRVAEGLTNSKAIAIYFRFDRRQSSYYREAAEALGLVRLRGNEYELTEIGREYVGLPPDKRNQLFVRLVLELPVMNHVFLLVLQSSRQGVGLAEIADAIRERSHLTGSTPRRRAQTVLAWFRWIEQALGIVRVHRDRIYPSGTAWF